jgi:phenylacetate-CoA ligase
VRAVGALRREGLPARLLIAGDDFSGGKDANDLARLAEQEGLGDAYRYLGPRSDVPALLRSVDVVALSSMAGREGAPRILVEAAASGVPVVATDVAGVGAIVVNGETGLLVPPDDYDAFVAALRDLLTDHARRDAMGQAAVAHARAHFSRAASATKLAALYTRLLAGER